MPQSPLGGFADLSAYQQLAAQPTQNPLDALIQGAQQGAAIATLPEQIQNKALNDQLARAVQMAKIQELQQGDVHNLPGVGLVRINPLTGKPEIIQPAAQPKEVFSEALGVFVDPVTHTYRRPTLADSIASSSSSTSSIPTTVQDIFPSTQQSITAPELGYNIPQVAAQSAQAGPTIPINVPEGSSFLTGTIAQRQAAKEAADKAAAEIRAADKTDQRNFTTSERKAHEEFLKGSIEQRAEETRKTNEAKAGVSSISPEALDNAAQTFAQTGVMPSLGNGGLPVKLAVMNKAAEYMKQMGVTNADALVKRAANKASQAELTKLQSQRGIIEAFSKSVKQTLGKARDLAQKVDASGVPVINRWINAGKRSITGDPDVAAFDAYTRAAVNEVARITTSPTGAGVVSDQSRGEINNILNTSMPADQYLAASDALLNEIGFREQGLQDQIDSTKEDISTFKPSSGEKESSGKSGSTSSLEAFKKKHGL